VHRAVALAAEVRFPTMAAFAEALVPFAGRAMTPSQMLITPAGFPTLQHAATVATPTPAASVDPATMRPVLRTEITGVASNRTRLVLLMAAGLLVLMLGLVAVLTRSGSEEQAPDEADPQLATQPTEAMPELSTNAVSEPEDFDTEDQSPAEASDEPVDDPKAVPAVTPAPPSAAVSTSASKTNADPSSTATKTKAVTQPLPSKPNPKPSTAPVVSKPATVKTEQNTPKTSTQSRSRRPSRL
jgi:hypothetical protein